MKSLLLAVGLAAATAACAGPVVHSRPDVDVLTSQVTAVIAMPPRLGYGRAADQRRAARRTGDTVISMTGGHAILAEELRGSDPEMIADSVRELGEDPARA